MILHLLRHPPVASHWRQVCYGRSDPGLSREGRAMIGPMVEKLAALRPDAVIHSDMTRTRAVAEPLARQLGLVAIAEPLWRERDFGEWEGKRWNAIYRMTGNAMDGMIDDPHHFRPGGGETTGEMVSRVKLASTLLPNLASVLVVSHGGAIACHRMIAGGMDYANLPSLIVKHGELCSQAF